MVGLLEHIRSLFGYKKNIMFGLYEPHSLETGVAAFGNGSYGWGASYTIDTRRPFGVALRFEDSREATRETAAASWSVTVELSQEGRYLAERLSRASAAEQLLFPRAGEYEVHVLERGGPGQGILVNGARSSPLKVAELR